MSIEGRKYVEQRYANAIQYYWRAGRRNKLAYTWSRYLAIVLGATVTLVASLSSAQLPSGLGKAIAIVTPLLAAMLTIIGGFSQSFQWGASWREMVLIAERLEAERDRLAVSQDEGLDLQRELRVLHQLVQRETGGFFDRVMGSSMNPPSSERNPAESRPEPSLPMKTESS